MTADFRFKQFTVRHDQCAMKVGTDGVLLGAWADVAKAQRILDIGTGSGIVTLMLAQRCPDATVDAVEVDATAAAQAAENFRSSVWGNRLCIHPVCITRFSASQPFDLIVSNPPWFRDSLQSPQGARTTARHVLDLTTQTLVHSVVRLLSDDGRFCIVVPACDEQHLESHASQAGLKCSRRCDVFPKPGKPAKRSLMEFSRTSLSCEPSRESLVVESENRHIYTDAFQALTKDFYLRF
jgi:tRNA1Val (adenine37-N6)-methyltransferase